MSARIDRFEDLIAWQKARALTREVYRATSVAPFSDDYALVRQIQRASVSIMSNLAEGFERFGPGEFHQFIVIAKGSCAEVRSLLYVAFDCRYLTEEQFTNLLNTTVEVSRVVNGLRTSIAHQRGSSPGNARPQ
jgi:four helix bundle protein